MLIKIQHRRGTASEWTSTDTVLAEGEIGFETDTRKMKVGDGASRWSQLTYYTFGTFGVISPVTASNFINGYTTTVTSGATVTLSVASNYQQFFTGSTPQTVVLPVASTMQLGQGFYINNNSSATMTINSSGGNLVIGLPANSTVVITCILTSGTTAASWDADFSGTTTVTGTGAAVLATSPTLVTPTLGIASATNIILGYTTTVTSATPITLTSSSTNQQVLTGSSNQTIVLPVVSTLSLGQSYYINNNSTGTITVNSSGGNLVVSIPPNLTAQVFCVLTSGTTAASWDSDYTGGNSLTGTGSLVLSASPTFTGTTSAALLNLTTIATATAATSYWVETTSDGIVRPKTLANVKAEVVTTAAVNSASATTVGTVTSGVWNATAINATYIDAAIARIASPTFTGTVTLPTGSASAAPLKFVSGVSLTTPVAGSVEFDGDVFYNTASAASTAGRGAVYSPQMVIAQANSTAATTTTATTPFVAANDTLTIENAKLYFFKGTYYFTSTFTSGTATIQSGITFSNAASAIKYKFKTYNQTTGTVVTSGVITSAAATTISPAITATTSYVTEFEGYFTSNATTGGTVLPFFQMSTTGSSTVATQFSTFEIAKMGASSTTVIAGAWL
jgi:hypothetical protein